MHKKKVCEILILYSVPCNFYFLIFIKWLLSLALLLLNSYTGTIKNPYIWWIQFFLMDFMKPFKKRKKLSSKRNILSQRLLKNSASSTSLIISVVILRVVVLSFSLRGNSRSIVLVKSMRPASLSNSLYKFIYFLCQNH